MKVVPDYLNGWKLVPDEEVEVISVTDTTQIREEGEQKMNERFFDIWHKYVIGNIEDFRIGLTQLEKEIRSDERRKFADLLPQAFCQYCNQEACEGGMVGSVQECETIRMLKDVIDELEGELNENNWRKDCDNDRIQGR